MELKGIWFNPEFVLKDPLPPVFSPDGVMSLPILSVDVRLISRRDRFVLKYTVKVVGLNLAGGR